MLTKIFNFLGELKLDDNRKREEEYLSQSCDLIDLERRQRQIQRGQAPWQTNYNRNLNGWV